MDNQTIDSSFFLSKKMFIFGVWNAVEKREDTFTIEQTVLPRDTEEQTKNAALYKLRGILSDKSMYAGQKIRIIS